MRKIRGKYPIFVQILYQMTKKGIIISVCSIAVVLVAVFLATRQKKYVAITGYAQGGKYVVTLSLPDRKTPPEDLKAGIDSILNVIDFSISGYNPESLLSKHNRGEFFEPDYVFSVALSQAYRHYIESEGVINCGAGALFDLWGFGFTPDSLPSESQIQEALAKSNFATYTGIADEVASVDPDQRVKFNFNAIAQGLSSDLVASYLYNKGVKDMLVNIGGEIVYVGQNPSGKRWRIGVDNPVDGNMEEGADLKGILECPENLHAIVTSGNYRKYYIKDGKKYAHTIDPRTGYPVTHNLLSATVIAENCLDADALATYCMVVGFEEAKALIERHPGLEGYLITSDGTWHSQGITIQTQDK